MDKYRFDDAYEKVYKYDEEDRAYYFYGSYAYFRIKKNMSETKMIEIVDNR